ncbi:MAG TPA: MFS transporter [Actinomycetota bacterium]|jgi:MFS family permease|nr:MFS transporter [Actinomycetota bacterium]
MSRVVDEFIRTFSSVKTSRNYRLFFFGQIVSVTGSWFNAAAASVLVLRLSNDGVALGVNTALLFLPVLLLGPWGGVLADRHDKRRILIGTQAAASIVAFAMWGLVLTDVVQLWMVYTLSLAAGVVIAIDNPARQSLMIDLVGSENLTNAVSLNSAVFTGARVVGMALAGELIHWSGLATCFLVDGISYAAVIVALLAMTPGDFHEQPEGRRARGRLGEGLRYVWETPELRRPVLVMTVVFTMAFNFMVLLPLFAYRTFDGDSRTFGFLSACAGAGMFLGAIGMANRATHPTPRRLATFAAAFGVFLALEAVMPTLDLALLAMIPLGIAGMAFAITANATLQLTSRPEMRGQVMAIYGMVFLGSTPIGAPIVGWIAEVFGARSGFLVGGLASLAVGIGALWVGSERWAEPAPAA